MSDSSPAPVVPIARMKAVDSMHADGNLSASSAAYRAVIQDFPDTAPPRAFARLAIAMRKGRRFEESEATLKQGLALYPGNRSLLVEYATLEMHQENWTKASEFWQEYHSTGKCSALNYNRYARSLEALQQWEEHESVVIEGIASHPEDQDLVARFIFNAVQQDSKRSRWSAAAAKLDLLRNRSRKVWPFPILFQRKEVTLRMHLSQLKTPSEQVEQIRRAQLNNAVLLWPDQLAGVMEAVDLSTNELIDADLRQALLEVTNFSRDHDTDIKSIKAGSKFDAIIRRLNHAITPATLGPLNVPGGFYKYLCRTLLSRGHLANYWLLRERYIQALATRKSLYSEGKDVSSLDEPLSRSSSLSRMRRDKTTHTQVDYADQLRLANETGDRKYYLHLRSLAGVLCIPKLLVTTLSSLYHAQEEQPVRVDIDPKDADFASYLKGKSVAIVGPVDVGLKNGTEIDNFDVVIRFNHRGTVAYDVTSFGARTHVSYYLHSELSSERNEVFLQAMDDLDFMVIDKWSIDKAPWLSETTCLVRNRLEAWQGAMNPLLFGSPNGIQRVLLDILRFDAARVKVFNSNLFLKSTYGGSYRKNITNPFPGMSLHDPASNFMFMKRSWENEAYEVDSVLEEVLRLSAEQYIRALGALYSEVACT